MKIFKHSIYKKYQDEIWGHIVLSNKFSYNKKNILLNYKKKISKKVNRIKFKRKYFKCRFIERINWIKLKKTVFVKYNYYFNYIYSKSNYIYSKQVCNSKLVNEGFAPTSFTSLSNKRDIENKKRLSKYLNHYRKKANNILCLFYKHRCFRRKRFRFNKFHNNRRTFIRNSRWRRRKIPIFKQYWRFVDNTAKFRKDSINNYKKDLLKIYYSTLYSRLLTKNIYLIWAWKNGLRQKIRYIRRKLNYSSKSSKYVYLNSKNRSLRFFRRNLIIRILFYSFNLSKKLIAKYFNNVATREYITKKKKKVLRIHLRPNHNILFKPRFSFGNLIPLERKLKFLLNMVYSERTLNSNVWIKKKSLLPIINFKIYRRLKCFSKNQRIYRLKRALRITKRKVFRYNVSVVAPDKRTRKKTTKYLKSSYYKKLSYFYGFDKPKLFLKFCLDSSKAGGRNQFLFFCGLEARIEIILLRINFIKSIYFSKKFIQSGNVFINNIMICQPSYILECGQILSINRTYFYYIYNYILNGLRKYHSILLNRPNYIEVDYKLFVAMIFRHPNKKDITLPMFFIKNPKRISVSRNFSILG